MKSRRWPQQKFLVAFSFAGEQRDYVRALAESVEDALGPDTVFLDEWFEYVIAGHDADLKLQEIYGQKCELLVVCVSAQYGGKPWTQTEHEAVRARLLKARAASDPRERDAILLIRVGEGEVPGIQFNTLVPDVRSKGLAATAQLIVDRLRFLLPNAKTKGRTAPMGAKVAPSPRDVSLIPASTPASSPGQQPVGRVKNEFCDRLAEDWPKLADELGIPTADQRQITARRPGAEGRGVWEWLEARKRLAELTRGCKAIDRADLADLLGGTPGAASGASDFPR